MRMHAQPSRGPCIAILCRRPAHPSALGFLYPDHKNQTPATTPRTRRGVGHLISYSFPLIEISRGMRMHAQTSRGPCTGWGSQGGCSRATGYASQGMHRVCTGWGIEAPRPERFRLLCNYLNKKSPQKIKQQIQKQNPKTKSKTKNTKTKSKPKSKTKSPQKIQNKNTKIQKPKTNPK